MKLYVLCGPPGSGKTTLSNHLAMKYKICAYHYDEFKKGTKPQDKELTHQKFYSLIKQELLNNKIAILDDLNLTLKDRLNLLVNFSDISCEKILIVMSTSLEKCLQRNKNRQKQLLGDVVNFLYKKFEPPLYNEEGWNEVYFLEWKEEENQWLMNLKS